MPFGKVNTPSLYPSQALPNAVNSQPRHALVELSKHLYQRALIHRASGYWVSLVFSFLVVLTVSYVVSSQNKSWDSNNSNDISSIEHAQPEPAQVSKERASNF